MAVALAVALACSSEPPGAGRGGDDAAGELPDQEITDFVMRETEGERVAWVFRAAVAMVFEQRNEILSEQLTVDFFDAEGRVSSVLTADRGTIQRRTNEMVARGRVVLRAQDGRTLETETLMYSPKRNKVYTDDFVRIIDGENVLTGHGLESDPDLRAGTFEIKRDVKATVVDPPEEPEGS